MRNLTLMTDLYQLTMMNGYFKSQTEDKEAVFDVFFRNNGEFYYAIACGLEQVVDYINNLKFTDDDIRYLDSLNIFDKTFLKNLKTFKFTGDIFAVEEGTIVFPGEPILTVKGKLSEVQLIETTILNIMNHQTLIATKANRIVNAAGGGVMEFGLRRAQGPDAGIYGARAAIIAGCDSTSNVMAGKMFDVPVSGTHSHSWVMSFENELEAFRAYASTYPTKCLLLVDTYNVLESGIPNAITVFNELRSKGYEPLGIRIDSGDLAYLSKVSREMLDAAGYPNAKICASGDLDEYLITSLKQQGACIDSWGVGTKLITSHSQPALGGVYKLSAIEEDGELKPKIKISNNPEKVTNPGFKTFYRIYGKDNKMAMADLICLHDETIDEDEPLTIFDPKDTWKKKTLQNFFVKKLPVKIYDKGKCVYKLPTLNEIKAHCKAELGTLWCEYKRIERPHFYKVDLSKKLFDLKQDLLSKN